MNVNTDSTIIYAMFTVL